MKVDDYIEIGGKSVFHDLGLSEADKKARMCDKSVQILKIMKEKKYSEGAVCMSAGLARNIFHDLKRGNLSHIEEQALDKILSLLKKEV